MKNRHGFVSNSSSSSFIIVLDKNSTGKIELTMKVDLTSYGQTISTIEELNEKFIEDHRWVEEETIEEILEKSDIEDRKEYNEFKKLINEGKKIITGSFCNDSGDAEETYLCENGLKGCVKESDGIQIIQSDGGY